MLQWIEKAGEAMERNKGEGPIYRKIKEDILQKIEAGEYKKSSRIEPERQLCLQYGVSRMTLRQAIEELASEGYLYKVQGRGTFVSTPAFQQKNLKSFTDTLRESGHEAKTKVLEMERVHQMSRLCQLLEVPVSMPLVKIKRLRYADEIPTALETVCLPAMYAPGIEDEDLSSSLYNLLETKYQATVETVRCDMEACISDQMQMRIFELEKPEALLRVEGISIGAEGRKLFYEISYYRSQVYRYRVDLYRRDFEFR